VGAAVSLAGWAFLVGVHEIQNGLFDDLPDALGLDPTPSWWALPMLLVGGALAALAITRLPGHGGHVPAEGLSTGPPHPIDLPGVILAALASLSFGAVLGPEAPLVALGAGLAVLLVAPMPRPIPPVA
jgi:H+/Cl- antiporter ClcA